VPAGTLHLNVPRPAAWLVLTPRLLGFVAAYQHVKVDVVTDDGLVDIVDDGFDTR
jgi:DNA-binding transcriptional LysR family regulator